MIVEVKAIIKFREDVVIHFDAEFIFTDEQVDVLISAVENGLSVIFRFKNVNLQQALAISENKLLGIASRLSWLENVAIEHSIITGHSFLESTGGQETLVMTDSVSISGVCRIEKKLEIERINELAKLLPATYSLEAEETLIMWRDSVSEKSSGLKFFLLFRLLEKVFGSRKNVDKWIKDNYPKTEMAKGQFGESITIYTFLRDNIHAKSIDFPFDKIKENLPPFQNIVQKAIKDKYKI